LTAGETPTTSDDLVTCLCKAVCRQDFPPKILTFSRSPAGNLLAYAFGPGAAINLVAVRDKAGNLAAGFTRADGAPAALADFDPAKAAIVARFVDAVLFERVAAEHGAWLAAATAVIAHFAPDDRHLTDLARLGFTQRLSPDGPGRPSVFLAPRTDRLRPRADARALSSRPAMRRLVVVDPCLGAASGHYLGYARSITAGAKARGVEVVWACHRDPRFAQAPADAIVKAVFRRCFFDIPPEAVGGVDLAPELYDGWLELLQAFDNPGAHFLVHSADAHQVRALARLAEDAHPLQSVIHINCQTSPRYMPGRVAGVEAHRAIFRLRQGQRWERSIFLWSEISRLGDWLSQWLAEEIPALPFLPPPLAIEPAGRDPTGPITLAFLGESRPSKGFHTLPDLMDRIAGAPGLSDAVKVVVQNWKPFRAQERLHEETLARLARHPFVEILQGVMTPADYRDRLSRTDILLLPYEPETYRLQGSGVLVEGLAQGAVILARAGNAVEDEAPHGVVEIYESADAFVEVLARLTGSWKTVSARARARAAAFRGNHSPERYVAALDARARGVRETSG